MGEPWHSSVITKRMIASIPVVFLGHIISGSYNTLNVALLTIQKTYNYTLTEANLLTSVLAFGFGMGMPAGCLLDQQGPKITSAVGFFISLVAMGTVYLSTLFPSFFYNKIWLLAPAYLFTGVGMFVTFTVNWTTGVRVTPPQIRSFVMGVFKAVILGIPAAHTAIYVMFFKNKDPDVIGRDDLSGYILYLTISFLFVDLLAILILKDDTIESASSKNDTSLEKRQENPVSESSRNVDEPLDGSLNSTSNQTFTISDTDSVRPHKLITTSNGDLRKGSADTKGNHHSSGCDTNALGQSVPSRGSQYFEKSPLISQDSSSGHVVLLDILKKGSYHLFVWSLTLALPIDAVVYGNEAVIARSSQLQTYTGTSMILSRALGSCSALGSGVLLRFLPTPEKRYPVLIAGIILQMTGVILMLISTEFISILLISACLISIGSASMWTVGAGLMFFLFGSHDFGRNWSIVIFMVFFLSMILSLIYGRLYDLRGSSSSPCLGTSCSRTAYFILLCSLCVSLLLCCVQLAISRRNRDSVRK